MMPLRDGVTVPAPREWAKRSCNVQRWRVMGTRRVFSGMGGAGVVADDIRAFFAGRC
jgi:hypothetical protein